MKNIRKIIIGVIIIIIGTLITQFIFDVRIYQSIWWFITIRFPLWSIILFVIILFVILKFIRNKKEEPKPDYLEYTIDKFKGTIYMWDYDSPYGYSVRNILAYCPNCKKILQDNSYCELCNATLTEMYQTDIKIEIDHNIQMNKYQKKIGLTLLTI